MPQLPQLPTRESDSHKGDYGRVLIVGGSRGMAGAAALAAKAALRSGAGLVKVATADCCLETVASFDPSYMTVGLPCDAAGRIAAEAQDVLEELAAAHTCLACGPGLGRGATLESLVRWMYRTIDKPMVFDADALNALAADPSVLRAPGGPRILTPHPGEFRRLSRDESASANEQADLAVNLAAECQVVLVLKGHRTLVTDGARSDRNATGNPGMATGGTGDVLTGVIAALLGQKLGPFDAARLGAYVHGLAGDLAVGELGQVSLIASDLPDYLPAAFQVVADQI